eukprot:7335035-Ditylum_brightwellii.AAC.1
MSTRQKKSKAETAIGIAGRGHSGMQSSTMSATTRAATEQTRHRQAQLHPFVGVWPVNAPTIDEDGNPTSPSVHLTSPHYKEEQQPEDSTPPEGSDGDDDNGDARDGGDGGNSPPSGPTGPPGGPLAPGCPPSGGAQPPLQ